MWDWCRPFFFLSPFSFDLGALCVRPVSFQLLLFGLGISGITAVLLTPPPPPLPHARGSREPPTYLLSCIRQSMRTVKIYTFRKEYIWVTTHIHRVAWHSSLRLGLSSDKLSSSPSSAEFSCLRTSPAHKLACLLRGFKKRRGEISRYKQVFLEWEVVVFS